MLRLAVPLLKVQQSIKFYTFLRARHSVEVYTRILGHLSHSGDLLQMVFVRLRASF